MHHSSAPTAFGPRSPYSLRRIGIAAFAISGFGLLLWAARTSTSDGLSVWAAIVLGLVEGLTEYLPVSSTGHLLVTNEILGIGQTPEAETALDAYAICIQAGAILAVLVLYQGRIRQMVDGLLGRDDQGQGVLVAVVAAFVPTALIGLALRNGVRDQLFSPTPIALAWLVGGLAILALTRSGILGRVGATLEAISIRQALIIGAGQAIALWPGVSRSLVTIVVGVLVGLSLAAAVEFSFLLGLATLSAATLLTVITDGSLLIETFGLFTPLVGLAVAFIAAVVSVRWMVDWLQQKGLDLFGYYRIVIGLALLAAVGSGLL